MSKALTSIRLAFWVGLLLLPGLACQTKPTVRLAPVGPPWFRASLGQVDAHETGFLTVYSATESQRVDDRNTYHPHTGYLIRNTNGSAFRWVENALYPRDEIPALVALPAGSYQIQAQDEQYGRVNVPVRIEPWRTTAVYLDGRSRPSFDTLNRTNSVRLPDGRMVGWRANRPQQLAGK